MRLEATGPGVQREGFDVFEKIHMLYFDSREQNLA